MIYGMIFTAEWTIKQHPGGDLSEKAAFCTHVFIYSVFIHYKFFRTD